MSHKYLIPMFKPIWMDPTCIAPRMRMFVGEYYDLNRRHMTIEDRVACLGMNTGNILFVESVVRELGLENCAFISDLPDTSREYVESTFSAIVVPSSNFISCHENGFLESAERTWMRYDLPIVSIGLGCQLGDGECPDKKTMNRVARLAERSHSIGVRGAFTADLLARNGIKNVEVIGCPSVFYNLCPDFRIDKKPFEDGRPVAFNTEVRGVGLYLLREMVRQEAGVLFQQNEVKFWYARRDANYSVPTLSWDVFRKLCPDMKLPEFRIIRFYLEHNSLTCFNVRDWQTALRQCQYSLGMRFHGNMMALQAGVPAVWVRHDARVRELVETIGVPSFELSENMTIDCRRIYEDADFSEFNRRYPKLYSNYCEFLSHNGISSVLRKDSLEVGHV